MVHWWVLVPVSSRIYPPVKYVWEARHESLKIDSLQGKHITFIGLNFYPEDTAIGLYSTQMVDALIDAGAIVTIITAVPYYPQWKIRNDYASKPDFTSEDYRGVTVYRYKFYVPEQPTFKKRVRHILSFTYGAYRNLQKVSKADLVISIIPFTASAWLGDKLARRKNCPHWIHIQDFEFDAAQQSGLAGGNVVFNKLFKLETSILDRAAAVSTISHNMVKKLEKKTRTPSYYLPNWISDTSEDTSDQPHPFLKDDRFKLLYSGNVGDKQDWEFFSAFAKALPQQHYQIIIVGAGARYQELKSRTLQNNIAFHDSVPLSELDDLLESADAHFLFQKTEVLDTVMPSKLLGMMASGRPSLVLGHVASEVKEVMDKSNAGFYLTKKDLEKAVDTVENWRNDKKLCDQMGRSAREFVFNNFAKNRILENWIQELSNLIRKNNV